MSLAFLAKKSWHTTNLKNVEKVWIAEQKADDETKKTAELQKQIQEERQIQELRQLQSASGQIIKHVDTSMDWMYEGPASQIQQLQNSEDFLLGKTFKPQEKIAGISDDAYKPAIDSSVWMSKVSAKNDSFTRVHEDPLLLIKQSEKKTRDSILSNPLKIARLKEQVEAQMGKLGSSFKDKKSSSSDSKKSRKEDKKKTKKESRSHKDRDGDDHKRRDSRDKDRDRDDDSDRRHNNGHDDFHHDKRIRHDKDNHEDGGRAHDSRYGLIKGKSNNRTRGDEGDKSSYLGPNPNLVDQKSKDEKQKEDLKYKGRGHGSNKRLDITDEERQNRLKQMEQDAIMNDELMVQRMLSARGSKDSSNEAATEKRNEGASFLRSMRSEVYNSNGNTVEARLHENRNYVQRGSDLDSHGFMKR